jgi:predicted nucleic acid-binding Zn ribbon protein
MKTIITSEDGKVTVQVDDQKPIIKMDAVVDKAIDLGEAIADHKASTVSPIAPRPTNSNLFSQLPAGNAITGKQGKFCEVCGDLFEPPTKISRFCSKKCGTKFYNKAHRDRVKAGLVGQPETKPEPAHEPQATYCAKCQAHTTHKTKDHDMIMAPAVENKGVVADPPESLTPRPSFLPGFEKSPEELAEIEKSYSHTTLPPATGYVEPGSPEAAEAIERVRTAPKQAEGSSFAGRWKDKK